MFGHVGGAGPIRWPLQFEVLKLKFGKVMEKWGSSKFIPRGADLHKNAPDYGRDTMAEPKTAMDF